MADSFTLNNLSKTVIPYNEGWTTLDTLYGATFDTATDLSYRIQGDHVEVAGTVVNESSETTVLIVTLPVGARPDAAAHVLIYDSTNDLAVGVDITTAGVVNLSAAPTSAETYWVNVSFPITNPLA